MILENEYLKLEIVSLGAELKSVYDKKMRKEILYEGTSEYWNRSAPILFPIVGKLKDNSYSIEDEKFELPQHGFARNMDFKVSKKTESEIILTLCFDEETLKVYPFNFELQVLYILTKNEVITKYKVINLDDKKIPFSIGAHPGFICPINENEAFEDYYLEFEQEETLNRHLLNTENGLFNSKTELVLVNSTILKLDYSYFEKDAIVFRNMKSSWIKIKSSKSDYCLKFIFKNYPYFGIWTKSNAPFICLEPWHGIADSENSSGSFIEKEGINLLEKNQNFECEYSFEVN